MKRTWHKPAKEYTEKTGVQVDTVTAASDNYDTTLMSEMGKSSLYGFAEIYGKRYSRSGVKG